jgi:hypothetical protein
MWKLFRALPTIAQLVAAALVLVVLILVIRSVGGWLNDPTGSKAVQGKFDKAGAVIGERGKAADDAAREATAAQTEREAASRDLERSNRDAIIGQKDSGVDAGDTGRAGSGVLCDRAVYRDNPRCAGLRPANPASTPR